MMIGHSQGPSMAAGAGWRTYCWQKARRELLPTLPIEILRRSHHSFGDALFEIFSFEAEITLGMNNIAHRKTCAPK